MSVNSKGELTGKPSDRARVPWKSSDVTIDGKPVAMGFHHVVPFAKVFHCWNFLAFNVGVNKCPPVMETFLRLVGAPAKEWRKAIQEGILADDQQADLEIKLTYPGWNIIEGPKARSDDPADSFDEYTHGITIAEANRQARLRDLHQELRQYNAAAAKETANPEKLTHLLHVLQTMERTLVAGRVIFFDQGMWRCV